MSAMIWLLPDFIGHPMCFSALAKELVGWATVHKVSYHRYWPYDGIENLAQAVVEDSDGLWPDWVAGYSFGGLVGYEVTRLLVRRSVGRKAPRLLLIDSRLRSPGCGGAATEAAELVGWDSHLQLLDKIESLAALGEIGRDCVEANLRHFLGYQPRQLLSDSALIAGRSEGEAYKSTVHWRAYLPDASVHQVDVAHQDMLTDPAALGAILSVFDTRECA